VRGTYDRMSGARGRYYLYYAPGGICLAYGDSLAGPFTEHPANPIIGATWAGHYNVSHVSSPHVLWHAASGSWYLYFHGENSTTRLATSADGITFSYYGVVLSTSMVPGISEASYARVFDHSIAALGSRYAMVYMGNQGGSRKIFWGWSADARTWRFDPQPLVSPAGDGLSGPHLLRRNNTTYVVYHGNSGKMYLTEVGDSFDREVHLGVFYTPLMGAPDSKRSAAPAFGTDRGARIRAGGTPSAWARASSAPSSQHRGRARAGSGVWHWAAHPRAPARRRGTPPGSCRRSAPGRARWHPPTLPPSAACPAACRP
jgi:hypothetical protein